MSRKYKHKYNQNNGFPIAFIFIILVLIVLQWFKVGYANQAPGPESNLVNNGGLFIIALFFLIICSCQGYYHSYDCNCYR